MIWYCIAAQWVVNFIFVFWLLLKGSLLDALIADCRETFDDLRGRISGVEGYKARRSSLDEAESCDARELLKRTYWLRKDVDHLNEMRVPPDLRHASIRTSLPSDTKEPDDG